MITRPNLSYPFSLIGQYMSQSKAEHQVYDPTQLQKIVGSLIYLTITQPDLSYPVSLITKYMS